MGIRSYYSAVAIGVAIGIVTAWVQIDPRITLLAFMACLIIAGLGAIGTLRQNQRRDRAKAAFDAASQKGIDLRGSVLADEPPKVDGPEDRTYWLGLLSEWNTATESVIHEYADDWHQKYQTWPLSLGQYGGMPMYRSDIVRTLDAKLAALAEIRTRL
jgi:hypothetical protein